MKTKLARILVVILLISPLNAYADTLAVTPGTGANLNGKNDGSGNFSPRHVTVDATNPDVGAPVDATKGLGVNVLDGSDATQGTTTDATWSGSGSGTVVAILKYIGTKIEAVRALLAGTLTINGTVTTTPPSNASTNIAQLGGVAIVVDPCQAIAKLSVAISQTANKRLFVGVSGKQNIICAVFYNGADAENLSLVEGTQTTNPCDTSAAAIIGGSTAATGNNFQTGAGFALGNGSAQVAAGASASGKDVCLFQSGTGQVSGVLTYVQK